jgi:hypothetical protein
MQQSSALEFSMDDNVCLKQRQPTGQSFTLCGEGTGIKKAIRGLLVTQLALANRGAATVRITS